MFAAAMLKVPVAEQSNRMNLDQAEQKARRAAFMRIT